MTVRKRIEINRPTDSKVDRVRKRIFKSNK